MLSKVCGFVKPGVSQRSLATAALERKTLHPDRMNPHLVNAQYAVRGEVVLRAGQLAADIASGKNLPFKEIIYCNIGNPQELGQVPITFFREVLALCDYPQLIQKAKQNPGLFSKDSIARAEEYLNSIKGGTGAYSHSQGVPIVRNQVAEFIQHRDGIESHADDIFLSDGASPAVQSVLRALIRHGNDGIMIPIPQYPLYSATIALNGGQLVGYYLNEESGWGLNVSELARSYEEAKAKGVEVRALAIINPGNPTGQCLSKENIQEVIDFCHRNHLVILADEVYQENIYGSTPFTSFKKALHDMGTKYDHAELVSFHSVSKGFVGECGRRGGYMETVGIHPEVKNHLYKLQSISLCPNVNGQIMMGLKVKPPAPGSDSYELYSKERDTILSSLARRSAALSKALSSLEGVSCQEIGGAMYAFPQITLPAKAVAAAKAAGKQPDTFYVLNLLENTGVCVVPGSGFGQKTGTWHFRTTFLPPEHQIGSVVDKIKVFHKKFMDQYRD
eukprot:TRINITY_DN1302_c0_g1_i1.p1 TRINITY_DN1302_c0_g1~~TRINITY_DN1302_c0_g1_i1.p1  ORF type:complete len:504 (-),score=99.84 TRINITY_DN1302_c0_g1_i1:219-1730(-)